jgi:hypothetical protein
MTSSASSLCASLSGSSGQLSYWSYCHPYPCSPLGSPPFDIDLIEAPTAEARPGVRGRLPTRDERRTGHSRYNATAACRKRRRCDFLRTSGPRGRIPPAMLRFWCSASWIPASLRRCHAWIGRPSHYASRAGGAHGDPAHSPARQCTEPPIDLLRRQIGRAKRLGQAVHQEQLGLRLGPPQHPNCLHW